jgi:hypothetical protein
MATTTAMYKGTSLKAGLVRLLRERGHPEEAPRPFGKWLNKEIVEALVLSDIARTGEAAAGVNQVYPEMKETEDNVEAAEDMKGASQRLWGSSASDLLARILLVPLIHTIQP